MTTKSILVCDWCGVEATAGPIEDPVGWCHVFVRATGNTRTEVSQDLCGPCVDALRTLQASRALDAAKRRASGVAT